MTCLTIKIQKVLDEIDRFNELATEVDLCMWQYMFSFYLQARLTGNSVYNHDMIDYVKKKMEDGILTITTNDEQFTIDRLPNVMVGVTIIVGEVMHRCPVLLVDKTLETLITDTKPQTSQINMPYTGFFINKKFECEDGGCIMGIYVADLSEIPSNAFLESKSLRCKSNPAMSKSKSIQERIALFFVHLDKSSISFIMTDVDDVLKNSRNIRSCSDGKRVVSTTIRKTMHEAMEYALNVASLITNHTDLKNPRNPKRDVQLHPYYPDEASRRQKDNNRMSIIRVFGALKEYTREYNKAKLRHHNNYNTYGWVVRGHWRHFNSDRFRQKKGKMVWIPPYVKGMGKELYQKVIKLTA
jgi:hypothetical protein